MSKSKKLQIRNSTAEFLVFTSQAGEKGIEVRVEDETVWLTQKLISVLFDVDVRTVSEHLQNIFSSEELTEAAVIRKFRNTASDGKSYLTAFYNLDAIIAVGFRVNSTRATQFRQWAIGILRDFAIRGYVLDKERLKNGAIFDQAYFDNLLAEIREIRASERRFYQKITDLYATAMDYSAAAETTQAFFATVQNKLHFAIHGHTAAELIVERADSAKEHMGLTTWRNAPKGKILKPDVVVAKNYLTEKELKSLDRFVTMYLDYAEDQAERGIPMTMADWAKFRGWRSCLTQPPANRWHPSGMANARVDGHHQQAEVGVIPEPGGFRAISRGLSAATPPETGRDRSRIPEGCQP